MFGGGTNAFGGDAATCGATVVGGLTYSRPEARPAPDTICLMMDGPAAGFESAESPRDEWGGGVDGSGWASRPWAGESTVGSTMMRDALAHRGSSSRSGSFVGSVGVGSPRWSDCAGGGGDVDAGDCSTTPEQGVWHSAHALLSVWQNMHPNQAAHMHAC